MDFIFIITKVCTW